MTTPAGWYDDGSGRQRWWDGQQWTEHFAPEAAAETATAAPSSDEPAASDPAYSDEPSLDDTVVRGGSETVITPEAGDAWSTPTAEGASTEAPQSSEAAQYNAAPQYDAAAQHDTSQYDAQQPATTSFTAPAAPPYVASAAPAYPGSAPAQPSGGYPGAYSPDAGGYPGGAAASAPQKVSILGLVGLGLSVLGTILVFIPFIGFIGFFFLAAGFIVSLISVFLKGKKWPGITGLSLAVVGTILGVVMFFVYLGLAFAQSASDTYDRPSSSATAEATPGPGTTDDGTADDGTVSAGRPTAPEIAEGLKAILAVTGTEGYTDEQLVCLGDAFVVSDLDDETLREIADSDGTLTDMDAASGLAEVLSDTDTVVACLT